MTETAPSPDGSLAFNNSTTTATTTTTTATSPYGSLCCCVLLLLLLRWLWNDDIRASREAKLEVELVVVAVVVAVVGGHVIPPRPTVEKWAVRRWSVDDGWCWLIVILCRAQSRQVDDHIYCYYEGPRPSCVYTIGYTRANCLDRITVIMVAFWDLRQSTHHWQRCIKSQFFARALPEQWLEFW